MQSTLEYHNETAFDRLRNQRHSSDLTTIERRTLRIRGLLRDPLKGAEYRALSTQMQFIIDGE